jgi:pantothenate kinase
MQNEKREKREEEESRVNRKTSLNLTGVLHVQIPPTQQREPFHKHERQLSGEHGDTIGATENHFILLPHHNEPISHFAVDIGGSLIKMVYLDTDDDDSLLTSIAPPKSPIHLSRKHSLGKNADVQFENEMENYTDLRVIIPKNKGVRICFARFNTADIEDCISFIEELSKLHGVCETVHATGGGAYKFASLLRDRLGIQIRKFDEMECLISGLNFLLRNLPNESFTYSNEQKHYTSFTGLSDPYPYLLVNIGSGVSILRVLGDREYERVSGSSIGGGTFWGLCSILTGVSSFEDLLDLTTKGDNKRVDMLVGDIYGKGRDYNKIGLATDTIASSFGKAIMKKTGENIPEFTKADIAKSLLFMICNNIGQIAYLNAVRYNLKRIYFAGYFIRDHPTTMRSLSYAINFWSKGEVKAMFLKHEGYLGSLGAFLEPDNHEAGSAGSPVSPIISRTQEQ